MEVNKPHTPCSYIVPRVRLERKRCVLYGLDERARSPDYITHAHARLLVARTQRALIRMIGITPSKRVRRDYHHIPNLHAATLPHVRRYVGLLSRTRAHTILKTIEIDYMQTYTKAYTLVSAYIYIVCLPRLRHVSTDTHTWRPHKNVFNT